MLPAFLDPLANAPRWQKVVLGVIGLVALGGLGYFFGISPLEGRVATLRAQRDSQQQEITRTRAMVADLTLLRRQATEVERQLDVVRQKLPTEREMPSLYRTLSDAAVQAGLTVTLFQPLGARVRDFYSEIPIALVGEGGYHEVGDFVGRVAALARTTTIGELKLTGAGAETVRPAPVPPGPAGTLRPPIEDGASRAPTASDAPKKPRPSLRAEMTLLTYVYRPVGSPPAPKPAAPEAPKQ